MTEIHCNFPLNMSYKFGSLSSKCSLEPMTQVVCCEHQNSNSIKEDQVFISSVIVERNSQYGYQDMRKHYVYPSYNRSPMAAFQLPDNERHKKSQKQQDLLSYSTRMSPLSVRRYKLSHEYNMPDVESDEMVSKIGAMFPTVSENHIKLLMKKYHNREALVISALQVDKYPITTPGPYATPPLQRGIQCNSGSTLHSTPSRRIIMIPSRENSPILKKDSLSYSKCNGSPFIGNRCIISTSTKSTSSPKLKLRYMKSLFPQAEEITILDVLANNESNIHKSSQMLKDLGYKKKDELQNEKEKESVKSEKIPEKKEQQKEQQPKKVETASASPKATTIEEKETLRMELQKKYKDTPEHIIKIALESVAFNEVRAKQILDIITQEDNIVVSQKPKNESIKMETPESKNITPVMSYSQSRQSIKSILKSEKLDSKDRIPFSRNVDDNNSDFKSVFIANTKGANPEMTQGPKPRNLLEKYITCRGPTSNSAKESKGLAKGSNAGLLGNRIYKVSGANPDNCKGSKFGLSRGSIYSHLKNIFCGKNKK